MSVFGRLWLHELGRSIASSGHMDHHARVPEKASSQGHGRGGVQATKVLIELDELLGRVLLEPLEAGSHGLVGTGRLGLGCRRVTIDAADVLCRKLSVIDQRANKQRRAHCR